MLFCLVVGVVAGLTAPACAQTTYTWGSATTGGTWSTTSNWTPSGSPGSADTAILNDATANRTVFCTTTGTIGTLTLTQSTAGVINELQFNNAFRVMNAVTLGASSGTAQITLLPSSAASSTATFSGGLTLNAGGALAMGVFMSNSGSNASVLDIAGNVTVAGGSIELGRRSSGGTVGSFQTFNNNLTMTSGSITVLSSGTEGGNTRVYVNGNTNITGGSVTATGGLSLNLSGATNVFTPSSVSLGVGSSSLTLGTANAASDQSLSAINAAGFGLQLRGGGVKTVSTTQSGTTFASLLMGDETVSGTTTLKLGSNLTISGALSVSNFQASTSGATTNFGIDVGSNTLTWSQNGSWATIASTGSGVTSTVWDLTGNGGTFQARNFNLNTANTTANIGAGLTLEATGSNQTSTLTGSGTIDATSTFRYAASGTGTLISTRAVGNVEVTAGTLRISTLSAGGQGAARAVGGTLDLNNTGYTFASALLNGGAIASGTLTVASGFDVRSGTASAVLAGAGGLSKTTAGAVTLSGANTYAGTTTLAGGVIALAAAETAGTSGPLGTNTAAGAIILSGGTLQYSASNQFDYSSRFSTAGSQQYNADTNGQSVTWAASLASSGGSLTKSGSGTLTLTAANAYDGTTAVTGGTLALGNGGTAGSVAGAIALSNTAALVVNRSNDITLGGIISGTGSLTKQGAGTLTLTQDATFSGTTTVTGGTLALGNGGTAGSVSGPIVFSSGAGLIVNRSTDLTLSGAITGTGSLTKQGAGTLTLPGVVTFSSLAINQTNANSLNEVRFVNTTTVTNAVTLGASSGTAQITLLPTAANARIATFSNGLTVNSGGVLAMGFFMSNSGSTATPLDIAGNVTVAGGSIELGRRASAGTASANNTFNNDLSMTSGSINVLSTGTEGGNSRVYVNGNTNISGGSVIATGGLALHLLGATNVFKPATLSFGGAGGLLALSQAGTAIDQSLELANVPSLSLTLRGGGVKTVSTPQAGTTFAGLTMEDATIAGTTTLKLGSNLTISGALAVTTQPATTSGTTTNFGIDVGSNTLTWSQNGSWATVVNSGSGVTSTVWDLTGNGGTFQARNFNLNTANTTANIGAGLTLEATGSNQTSTLTGNGTIDATSTFRYAASGTGTLISTRAVGNVEVTAGTLRISTLSAGGQGAARAVGGTLDLNNTGYTFASALLNGGAIASGTLTVASGFDVRSGTASAVLAGAGGLSKTTAGAVTLSGANTYAGTTTLAGGVVALAAAETAGTSGPLGTNTAAGAIILSGGTLQYSASNQFDYSSRFSTAGSQQYNADTNGQSVTWAASLASSGGSLTKSGSGTLTLTAANAYDGTTAVTGGTLALGNGGTAGSVAGAIALSNTAALVVNRSNDVTLGGIISGTGSLTKQGAGTLFLSAANTYTGATTITAGTIALSGGNDRLATGGAVTFTGDGGLRMSGNQSLASISLGNNVTAAVAGGGSLTVTGPSFSVVATGSNTSQALDASGLSAFTYSNTGGSFRVGGSNGSGVATGRVVLPSTSVLTAATISIGADGGNAVVNSGTLTLGTTTTLSASTITLGAALSQGVINFSNATDPTLTIRGVNGIDPVTTMTIGTSGGYGLTTASRVDLTGGVTGTSRLDAVVTNLIIGQSTRNTSFGQNMSVSGALLMQSGTLTATTLTLGQTLNNPTFTGGSQIVTGTLSVSGGTVNVGTLYLADQNWTAGTVSGVFSLDGGGTLNAATIASGTGIGAGASSRTFTWNNGTIANRDASTDLSIGSGIAFTLASTGTHRFLIGTGRSGTVASVMAGAGGTLEKAGDGTLTLSAANTYSGHTTAGAGVLRFGTLATGTGAQALGSGSVVNLGAAATSAGEIAYTGSGGTLDKNIFALGTGRNRIRNSGAGTLTLSGTLTKNGTILELAGGTFNVTGQITGSSANSDFYVNGASVTLSNTSNNYNGPTYIYGNGTLTLGASNVVPAGSSVLLGGTGSDTGSGAIITGTFTDTVASLTTSALSGTVGITVSGATAGGLTMTNLTLGGSNDTLALTLSSLSQARYQLLTYTGLRSGTFDTVTGLDAAPNYTIIYGSGSNGSIDLALKANQTLSLSPVAARVLVGGSTTLNGTLVNSQAAGGASLAVSLSSNGTLTANNFSSSTGASVAAGGTATISATLFAADTAGSQSWSVVNTDSGALATTATSSGSISVVNQRTFSISNSGTINLGNFLRTAAVTGSSTISSSGLHDTTANATLAPFSGANTNGYSLGTLASATFNGAELNQSVVYTLSGSAATAGAINGNFTSDVTAELGSISPVSVAFVGTAYDPATASFASGLTTTALVLDIGEFNQNTGDHTKGFSIYNLLADANYTADLTLLSITGLGTPSDSLSLNLTGTGFGNLQAGGTSSWLASLSSLTTGSFSNQYQLTFASSKNGQSLGGEQSMTLTVSGIIVVPEPGALALAGIGAGLAGWSLCKRRRPHQLHRHSTP